MEQTLQQLSKEIKELKQKCIEISTNHSFVNPFFSIILDNFDKEFKISEIQSMQKRLYEILHDWHWFYSLCLDEFLYYFHHKTIGKRTHFLKDVLKIRSFDEMNNDMRNKVDKKIGKKSKLTKLCDTLENLFNDLENYKNDMFDQLKLIKDFSVEIKARLKLIAPQLVVYFDAPYHDEHSSIVVKIKNGDKILVNLEPTTYLNGMNHKLIGREFLIFVRSETDKNAISSSLINEKFGFFYFFFFYTCFSI
jgi:hypothetical protein